ncbi:MAG: tagatose 1,6-diphosphate aldolase [Acidobacteriota bacterium]|nr:MAG: tagatose 1,6-diphosphate aldolase [Acidobacteriota bacterium]
MRELTVGKLRGLQRCSTERKAFAVLALDHRNNLRRALNPEDPAQVSPSDMTAFKNQVVSILSKPSSAVLLDPEVGAAQAVSAGAISAGTGLVVAVEATGYDGAATARDSRILEGWSVAKAKRMGADAIKLLVYYHPGSSTAQAIRDLVNQTAEDCAAADILLMVEPLSYSLDSNRKLTSNEKHEVVLQTAVDLTFTGVDVLKAEFPLDVAVDRDEHLWQTVCRELSEASPVPWILLSAGVSYETYLRQVVIACEAGASGVAAGRAVWKEAVGLDRDKRHSFLWTTAADRMKRLTSVCDALGRPYSEFFTPPEPDENWYQTS